jgi:hypothetical protein
MISDKFEQFFNAGLIIESSEDRSSGIVALLLYCAFALSRFCFIALLLCLDRSHFNRA